MSHLETVEEKQLCSVLAEPSNPSMSLTESESGVRATLAMLMSALRGQRQREEVHITSD